MRKAVYSVFLSLIILVLGLFTYFTPTYAVEPEYDWVIDKLVSQVQLQENDDISVTETISTTFDSEKHGIIRQIPETYDTGIWYRPNEKLKVKVNSVKDGNGTTLPYTIYTENGYENIKIGDANVYITGKQVYKITYTIKHAISFFDNYDEFYLNVTGNYWSVPIKKAELFVKAPFDFSPEWTSICYTGQMSSTEKNCSIKLDKKTLHVVSTAPLNRLEGLTVGLQIPKGQIKPPSFWQIYGIWILINSGILLPIPVFFYTYRFWDKKGRDPKGRGAIVPQFDRPKNIIPSEAGVLIDNKANDIDISAMIIDLAIRGYLRIEEISKSIMGKDYKFYLLDKSRKKLEKHELMLLNAFDEKSTTNGKNKSKYVKLSDLKNTFYITVIKIQKELYNSLIEKELYTVNPQKYKTIMVTGGIALIIGTFVFGTAIAATLGAWGSIFGLVISGIIITFFGLVMSQRTVKGTEALEYIKGLKMYIGIAEKDRIEMMQSPDSQYIKAPDNTIDLFEKLLPFAIVLGIEKQWGKKFKDIYKTPPEWYQGNYNTFTTGYLLKSIHGANKAFSSSLSSTPPQSSSSSFRSSGFSGGSGFGGSGFSGGGVGGGGGSSW